MTTLHLSHTVNDFDEWLATFSSFADFRTEGGVTDLTVSHAVDDPNLVAVDLRFGDAETARAFLKRLETEIWPSSPHIDGPPSVQLLEPVAVSR